MRKAVLACAILPYAGTASAAEQGLASYYCPSSGGLVAAHRSLAIGSQVRVVNLDNGLAVIVLIAGRGPFLRGRVIDVSIAAADALGFRKAGLAHVRLELL